LLIGKPFRVPAPVDTQSKTDRMNFLSQYTPPA
jgi:hypothetical protein